MKPRTLILMVVAIGCGLAASYMTSRLLAERGAKKEEPTVPVLMVKKRVPGWQPIKQPDQYFEIKQVPVSLGLRKPIGTFEEIRDQRLNKSLNEGAFVLADDLLSKEQVGLDGQLQPGQRAVSVKVTAESLVSGFVLPGSRVDVVWTKRGQEASAKTILQNMLVLAIDAEDTRSSDKKNILGQNVTLAATVEEASRLALAGATGDLRLLLRGHGDNKTATHVSIKLSDLDQPISASTASDLLQPRSEPVALLPPSAAPVVSNPLPQLTEEEKPAEEPPAPPAEVEKPRKKPHIMIIYNGLQKQKVPFVLGEKADQDEEETTPSSSPASEEKTPNKPATPAKKGTGK